ncbi:MAG: spermidine/putrescine ABC transporter substrate-binding protein [Clostridia bacterium]|nr:spermidine/putrescine ABC transporter substrate-binding protein [Clostridia bacterium]
MKKWLCIALALVLCVLPLAGCGAQAEKEELIVYTWTGYIPDDVIQAFEEETGINVIYNSFETNEEMLAKLENTNGGEYDLVLASDYIIKLAGDKGLIGELDKEQIPNLKNIDPLYQGFFYDPENKLTVPYAPGIPLIVYDPSRVSCEITGYSSLWDPSLKDSIAVMDSTRVINGFALKTLGESFNTEDLDKIRQAGDKLLTLAPNIRLLSVDQTHEYLLNEEVSVALLFTSQVALALQGNPNLKVVYPTEGLGFGVDAMFVPSQAPNADNAYAFLNYILDGKVGAHISEQILYLCPNQAAYEFLPEAFADSLKITGSDIPNGEFIMDVSADAAELHNQIYTAFKAACGQ